jgi:hypothetical protein
VYAQNQSNMPRTSQSYFDEGPGGDGGVGIGVGLSHARTETSQLVIAVFKAYGCCFSVKETVSIGIDIRRKVSVRIIEVLTVLQQ